jgi:uncharacterized protein YaaN involved in tellurite resistance
MEEENKQEAGPTVGSPAESAQTDLVKIEEVSPPRGMAEEEALKVKNQAAELVKRLGEVTGSKELELIDNLSNMGLQSQRSAANYLDLLKARVASFLDEGGPSREIANSLRDLRVALEEIDPHGARSNWQRLAGFFPFPGRYNPIRVLQRIAIRYEPVSRQVTIIETRLREGRTLLARDNVELRKLYEQLEAQGPSIRRNAYLGELLIKHLAQLVQSTSDPMKRERVRGALHDVTMRVQDLRTMEEVHIQYFVSIEMSRQNNNRLGQSVDRTLTLATNVVTVGLAIQAALVRQKRVLEATRRTREFLGTLVAANASAIKKHTQEIGDLYTNPVIAIEKITQAHNDLVEAMDIADRLRREGISAARDNIARLAQMSASLMQRASGLLEQGAPSSGTSQKASPEGENPGLEA